MDNAVEMVRRRLSGFPESLRPVVEYVEPLLGPDTEVSEYGAVYVASRIESGMRGFEVTIHPACTEFMLDPAMREFKGAIPKAYEEVLLAMSGLEAGTLSLYGISMGTNPADLGRANNPHGGWIGEYGRAVDGMLHFGSRDYGEDDILGYFMDDGGRVHAHAREAGKKIAEWDDFASFLRHELAAKEPRTPLPPFEEDDDDVEDPPVPTDLHDELARKLWAGCPTYAARALELKRDCLHLHSLRALDEEIPVGSTKLGGAADLPVGSEWPSCRTAAGVQPLHLVAQINLAQLNAGALDPALPEAGLLSFFYDADNMPETIVEGPHDCWRVLYSPPGAELARLSEPTGLKTRLRSCLVQAKPGTSLPSIWDTSWLEGLGMRRKQRDAYEDISMSLLDDSGCLHQFMGYDTPVQQPACEDAVQAVNGCYQGGKFNKKKWKAVQHQVSEWRLLLQVDSDSDLDVMWGDLGAIYFVIRNDDLLQRRFDRAWLVLQCH